ncbi:hypothetical protein CCACVL1_14096 [Corchorus capsularis]|uniref:PLAC8 family protein n=1 Tax=Corchorus capsularis TaxID=210143 RepID=A0A1R3I899_COCAP|nr:hypothetical protein CCACVL1_14096 [Corchorus capsularis]
MTKWRLVRLTEISGTLVSPTPLELNFPTAYLPHAGTNVAGVTCLAAVGVAKEIVLNFVYAPRFAVVSVIQLLQLVFFFKMNSIYRPRNGFMLCLGQVACIFRMVALITGSDELQDASEILTCLSDCVYCTVCACMQTQHKIEMDKRDGKFGPPMVMMVPPVQQMSRIDHPVPPTVGYAPQPRPLQPPYGHLSPHPPPQKFPSGGYPLPPPRAQPHPLFHPIPQPHPH